MNRNILVSFVSGFLLISPAWSEGPTVSDLEVKIDTISTALDEVGNQAIRVSQVVNALQTKIKTVPLTINVGDTIVNAGDGAIVPISFTPGTKGISTVQFDLLLPVGVSSQSVVAGQASVAAGKGVQSSSITGGVRVIIFGLNQNSIGAGALASANLKTSSVLPPGLKPIKITNIVASDGAGVAVALVGYNGSITID